MDMGLLGKQRVTFCNETQNKRMLEKSRETTWQRIEMRGKGKLRAFMVQKKRSPMGAGIPGRERFIVAWRFEWLNVADFTAAPHQFSFCVVKRQSHLPCFHTRLFT